MRTHHLLLPLLLATGCVSTTTVTRYEVEQSAWLADPGPRAVGAIAADEEWHLEAGYERTFVTRGPGRAAGGNGHSPSVNSAHLRAVRGFQPDDGPALEWSAFAQLGLSTRCNCSEPSPAADGDLPKWAGLAFRLRSSATAPAAALFTAEGGVGSVPFARAIKLRQTTTYNGTDPALDPEPTYEAGRERTAGTELALRFALGLHADLLPAPGFSVQPGLFAGTLPYAKGRFVTSTTCTDGSCSGRSPDEIEVLGDSLYAMPTLSVTVPLDTVAIVATGWWMAGSTRKLEETTPFGLSLTLRARL